MSDAMYSFLEDFESKVKNVVRSSNAEAAKKAVEDVKISVFANKGGLLIYLFSEYADNDAGDDNDTGLLKRLPLVAEIEAGIDYADREAWLKAKSDLIECIERVDIKFSAR